MEISEQQLASLLEEAQEAHHEYEQTIEGSDDQWANWYAQYIHKQLSKD